MSLWSAVAVEKLAAEYGPVASVAARTRPRSDSGPTA